MVCYGYTEQYNIYTWKIVRVIQGYIDRYTMVMFIVRQGKAMYGIQW